MYELTKHGLRGSIPQESVARILDDIDDAFAIATVDDRAVLTRAARLSHGAGLSMADSLIASSLEAAGCTLLYTTGRDFERYKGPMEMALLR